MAKEEQSGFEPLWSACPLQKMYNALENRLLFMLQLGSGCFPFTKRQGALEFDFKTSGIGQAPCLQNPSGLLRGIQPQILCCSYRNPMTALRRNVRDLSFS
jgi:hypothetical protein